jgi:hypothetical protein
MAGLRWAMEDFEFHLHHAWDHVADSIYLSNVGSFSVTSSCISSTISTGYKQSKNTTRNYQRER